MASNRKILNTSYRSALIIGSPGNSKVEALPSVFQDANDVERFCKQFRFDEITALVGQNAKADNIERYFNNLRNKCLDLK